MADASAMNLKAALIGTAMAITLSACGGTSEPGSATPPVKNPPPTVSSATVAAAQPAQPAQSDGPVEDPRCAEARRAVYQSLRQYWNHDVLPQRLKITAARALTNFGDLYQLGSAELTKHEC